MGVVVKEEDIDTLENLIMRLIIDARNEAELIKVSELLNEENKHFQRQIELMKICITQCPYENENERSCDICEVFELTRKEDARHYFALKELLKERDGRG